MIINSVRFRFRPKVINAYHFAKTMHAGQVDKAGNDYFTSHVLGVVNRLGRNINETTYISALLHDVVEDTETTISEIFRLFGKEVACTVATLTKTEGESYVNYIHNIWCGIHREAVPVKIADLTHNLSTPENISTASIKKYEEALTKLTQKGEWYENT